MEFVFKNKASENKREKQEKSRFAVENQSNNSFADSESREFVENVRKKPKLKQRNRKTIKKHKRGPYKKYDEEVKKEAVDSAAFLGDLNKASLIHKVPLRSLKHWIKTRKSMGQNGRKINDLEMEENLKKWICVLL